MPEIGASHKLTHQLGGNDELSLAGMAPGTHKTTHQNAGADEISVLGLSGLLGDSQTPLAHKTSHQNGGADEISVAGLAGRQIFVPYNAKIADIREVDTGTYLFGLATPLSETRKIVAVMLMATRESGTGSLYADPNEGPFLWAATLMWDLQQIIIKDGTQRFQYHQSVANDDFDLYCLGYVVET